MLYDPKWEKVWTKVGFADWLSQQPPGQSYNYCNPGNCAAAQYLKAHGVADSWLTVTKLKELGWNGIVLHGRQTFGAAAHRARRAAYGPWWMRAAKAAWRTLASAE